MAVVLAVALQDDVKESIHTLHVGYNTCAKEVNKNATHRKWLFSYLLQLVTGMAFLVATFILVMAADNVVDIFLNFAALEFITQIDDVAFKIAAQGYTTIEVKKLCIEVKNHAIPDLRRSFPVHRMLLVLLMVGMLGMWGFIYNIQASGSLVCGTFFVQFGDSYQTFLPTYSGFYDRDGEADGRRLYKLRGFDGEKTAYFRYCKKQQFWVFQTALLISEDDDYCKKYLMWSEETTIFDMKTLDTSKWTIYREEKQVTQSSNNLVAVDYFHMDCVRCAKKCQGTCSGEVCECSDDRFGDFCEFEDPCPQIGLNANTLPFTLADDLMTSQYSMLEYTDPTSGGRKPVRVHNRPVFAYDWAMGPMGSMDYIVFNGRRWIMKNLAHQDYKCDDDGSDYFYDVELDDEFVRVFDEVVKGEFGSIFADGFDQDSFRALGLLHTKRREFYARLILEDQFHLLFSDLGTSAEYISGPVDFGTPSNSIVPTEIGWYRNGPSPEQTYDIGQPVDSQFLCKICNEKNGCFNGGTCVSGECQCPDTLYKLEGLLCEKERRCPGTPCANGGTCDIKWAECFCADGFNGPLCENNV